MTQIIIIETGEVISEYEFYERYPTLQLPQPLTDAALESYGARLAAVDTGPAVVPSEVPRWAGLLALKRHELRSSELLLLASDDDGANSLHAAVLAFRGAMPAGEARDRLDVALNDAKDWLRTSPTVQSMCSVLSLTGNQADALFVWADAQVGTV